MVSGEQAIVNQLCKISDDLISLRKLSEKKDERDVDIFFMNVPEDGGTRTFATGITKINFKTGIIVNPDGSTVLLEINMGVRDFMHSLNVITDKDIKIRLDSSKQHTISANNQETIPYITYTSIDIECTESTEITLFACTNPSTVLGSFMTVLKGQNGVVAQEATGELITVIKGDQGRVAQDGNNNLITVMKGNYEGALKTWKVDEDGRGEMFINDLTDDWGRKNVIGLAELATRLNAKQHFDNRGRQIWTDGFESTALKWHSFAAALGAVARDTTYAWHDDASIKLTTGAADFSTAAIYKSFYNPLTGRYGIEITWSTNTTNLNEFGVYLYFCDGSKEIVTGLLFRSTGAGGFYYVNSTGGYTKLTTIPNNLRADRHQWHKLKFVFDSDIEEYVRILIDGHEVDMTGVDTKSSASGVTPYIKCAIELFGDASNAYDSYVDNIIFTHLEP